MIRTDRERTTITWQRAVARILILLMICTVYVPLQTGKAHAASVPGNVTLKSVTQDGGTLKVKWYRASGCTGYQVQYSPDRYFLGKKTKKIQKARTTSKTIRWLDEDVTYYVRVRSYKKTKKKTTFSAWTMYNNVPISKSVPKERMKSGLKKFELRKAAKQSVPGYDSLQGACYGKGYIYCVLNNRNTGACKIAKVRLRGMKVVKVSAVLPVHHGNDITYNSRKNQLVVAHSTGATKTVSVISPSSLEIKYNAVVELPDQLEGLPKKKRKYYNGFGAIAYNAKYNQYVVLLRGAKFHHLMILDSSFRPVRFLYLDVKATQTVQGMDSLGNTILVGQSYGGGSPHNNVLVYDWNGTFKSILYLGKKYEFETIFHSGKEFYAGFYTSYYKYIKKKKRNELQRDGYIFRLKNL